MASNFARRLDKLERLIRERIQPDTSPLYFREGASIPEEIARERVIFIKRAPIDPPEREQEELPEMAAEPEEERKPLRNFDQPIRYPNLGILFDNHRFLALNLADFYGLFCLLPY
jgi:hypothetical protein